MAYYEEGKIKYSSDDKGNVAKVDTSTGRVVNIPAGDSRMQYIPTQVGGTRGGGGSQTGTADSGASLQQSLLNAMNRPIDEDDILSKFDSRFPMPKATPTLSYGEAQSRAQGQINPLYQQNLKDTLAAVDKDSIRRGFFGQMPAAAYKGDTAARLEAAKNAQIAQLANSMVGQSEEAARAQQALGLQQWQATSNAFMNALNTAKSDKQNELANLMALMTMSQQQKELDRPYSELTAAQKEQQRQFDLGYALDQKRVDYDTNKPYYSPNTGGSGSSGGPTPTQTRNTYSDAYEDIDAMISEGVPLSQILGYIDRMGDTLKMYGVDVGELTSWAKKRATGNTSYVDNWQYALR